MPRHDDALHPANALADLGDAPSIDVFRDMAASFTRAERILLAFALVETIHDDLRRDPDYDARWVRAAFDSQVQVGALLVRAKGYTTEFDIINAALHSVLRG
jgi:hypothetical protein